MNNTTSIVQKMGLLADIGKRYSTLKKRKYYGVEHLDILADVDRTPIEDFKHLIHNIAADANIIIQRIKESDIDDYDKRDLICDVAAHCRIDLEHLPTIVDSVSMMCEIIFTSNTNVSAAVVDWVVENSDKEISPIHPDLYMKFIDGPEAERPKYLHKTMPWFFGFGEEKYSREAFIRFHKKHNDPDSNDLIRVDRIIGFTAEDIANFHEVVWAHYGKPICIPGLTAEMAKSICLEGEYINLDDTLENIIAAQGFTYKHLANPFIDKRKYLRLVIDNKKSADLISELIEPSIHIFIDEDTADILCSVFQSPQHHQRIRSLVIPTYPVLAKNWTLDQIDVGALPDVYWKYKLSIMRQIFDDWTKKTHCPGGVEYHRCMM